VKREEKRLTFPGRREEKRLIFPGRSEEKRRRLDGTRCYFVILFSREYSRVNIFLRNSREEKKKPGTRSSGAPTLFGNNTRVFILFPSSHPFTGGAIF